MNYIKRLKDFVIGNRRKSLETPQIIIDNIEEIDIKYIDFNGNDKIGKIVCNKKVSSELKSIFEEIYNLNFPIYQMRPVSEFDNDDEKSVINNNTSCFNFRFVMGSKKLSDHSTGNAIDINPMQNPWMHPMAHKINGREYDESKKGTITQDVVNIFRKYGWNWGGVWKTPDYQHFFKADLELKEKVIQSI